MPAEETQFHHRRRILVALVAGLLVLCAIAWLGLAAARGSRLAAWILTLALMSAFFMLAGYAVAHSWRGVLIDARNRTSLARLQASLWGLVVFSALFLRRVEAINRRLVVAAVLVVAGGVLVGVVRGASG